MENMQLYPANYMPTGFNQVINTNTGEVSDAVSMLIPTGSKVITPDQLEAIEKKKAKDGARRLRKMNNSELAGRMGFYFIPNSADFKGLSSATVTRLIYRNYSVGLRNPQFQHKVENWKGSEKNQRNVNIQEAKKVVC